LRDRLAAAGRLVEIPKSFADVTWMEVKSALGL
jgi:hypothetical protein